MAAMQPSITVAFADAITHADSKYQFQVNPIKPRSQTAGLAVPCINYFFLPSPFPFFIEPFNMDFFLKKKKEALTISPLAY